jgi:hypothetical protein
MAYQPKSYRKFIATAATATLVASAVAPVVGAAASFTDVAPKYADAVNYLVANNITKGATETTFGTSSDIKRGDAAIWLAAALKLDTAAAGASGFKDTAGTRYEGAVAALKAKGIISGSGDEFKPSDKLTRGEMAKMLANGYALTTTKAAPFTDKGETFGTYIDALYEYKVTTGKTETTFGTGLNITRGDLAIFLKRASEVVKTPQVVAASAANGKELVITFSTALNATEAAKLTNYSLTGETFESATVSTDGKVVTLKAVDVIDVTNATLQVEAIQTKADAKVSSQKYVTLFSYKDGLAPSVASVDAKGTTAVINLSEPVATTGTVSLDGVQLSTGYTLSADGKTLTLTGLTTEKTYKVDLVGATDFAGNIANPIAVNFTVAKPVVDNSKPTVSTTVNGTKVTLDFSEELAAVDGVFAKVTVGTSVFNVIATNQDATDKTLFVVDVKDALGANAFINSSVKVDTFKDAAGNAGDAFTFNATLVKDTTAPKFVSATAKIKVADSKTSTTDLDSVYLTFDEAVTVGGNFTLQTKNGILYTTGNVVTAAGTSGVDVDGNGKVEGAEKNTIEVSVDLDESSSYVFVLAGNSVKDADNNTLTTDTNVTFTTGTFSAAPTQASATLEFNGAPVVGPNGVITVEYKVDVTSSAVAAANYTLGGKSLPAGTTVQFLDGTKKVRITLPEGSVTANGTQVLEVKNVVDTAGNTLKGGKQTAALYLNENIQATVSSITVANSKTFTVGFSEAIALPNGATTVSGVTVKINGATVTPATLSVVGGKLQVTTTADFALTAAFSVELKNTNLVDLNGNKVKDGVVTK